MKSRIIWFQFVKWPGLNKQQFEALEIFASDEGACESSCPARNGLYYVAPGIADESSININNVDREPFVHVMPGATSRDGGKTWRVEVRLIVNHVELIEGKPVVVKPIPAEQLQLLHDALELYPRTGPTVGQIIKHICEEMDGALANKTEILLDALRRMPGFLHTQAKDWQPLVAMFDKLPVGVSRDQMASNLRKRFGIE